MKKNIITSILLFFISLLATAQKSTDDEWIRVFWEPEVTYSFDLIETYDKGYLMDLTIRQDYYQKWVWLIKTDINGNILWDKKIGNGIDFCGFVDVHQTPDGGYVLAGGTSMLDNDHGDTFFMKLNACGEKEWCRIFHISGQYTSFDFGMNIFPLEDGSGYIALVSQWGDQFIPGTGVFQGIWLFKLDMDGNSVWMKNVFDEVNPEAWNEIPNNMLVSKLKSPDNVERVIITGEILYNDFGGQFGYVKPVIYCADATGNELWWYIYGQDSYYRGKAFNSVEDDNYNIFSLGWYTNYNTQGDKYYPALFMTDKDGNEKYAKYVLEDVQGGKSFCLNIINDTILDIGGGWFYPNQSPGHAGIMRTDTNGNEILRKEVWETDFTLYRSVKTFDNKELFIGTFKDTDGKFKVYLHKFNSDLEYDTIYTQPMDYDYMCDELPIVSDTIGIDDCAVWTMLPGETEYRMAQHIVIYPNPATTQITIRLPRYTAEQHKWGELTSRNFNAQYHKNSVLYFYNIYGEKVMEIPLSQVAGEELNVNISKLASGVYQVVLLENMKVMSKGRFIKN